MMFPMKRSAPAQWHRVYFLLAAFDVLTVSVSLYLNHRIMSIYRQSVADEWTVVPGDGGALVGEKRTVALTTEVARVDVEIRGSVWESLARAGEDPGLASAASDVLAWDVDFYQDVRSGDRMKVLVEKVYADGRLLRYGEVETLVAAGTFTRLNPRRRGSSSTGPWVTLPPGPRIAARLVSTSCSTRCCAHPLAPK